MSIYNFGHNPTKVDIKIEAHTIICEIYLFATEWNKAVTIITRRLGSSDIEDLDLDLNSIRRNMERNIIKLLSKPQNGSESAAAVSTRYFSEDEIRRWLEKAFSEIVKKKEASNIKV